MNNERTELRLQVGSNVKLIEDMDFYFAVGGLYYENQTVAVETMLHGHLHHGAVCGAAVYALAQGLSEASVHKACVRWLAAHADGVKVIDLTQPKASPKGGDVQ